MMDQGIYEDSEEILGFSPPTSSEESGSSPAKSSDAEIKVSSCRITFQMLLSKYCRHMLTVISHFYKVIRILAKEEKKRDALKLGDWPKVCDYAI
jgi:hypothetical protein